MYDNMDINDFPGMEKPGVKGIKVLTTLSIIGCAFQFVSSIAGFFGAEKSYEMAKRQSEQMSKVEMPEFLRSLLGDPELVPELAKRSLENKVPLLILSLVSLALSFYGVLEMRKMKKEGFPYYVIGELLPVITTPIFMGAIVMQGIGFYFGLLIPLLFIILYAVRRKYMV